MFNSTGQVMNGMYPYTPPNTGGFAGWIKRQRTGSRQGWSATGTTLTKKRRPGRGRSQRTFTRKVLNVFPAKHLTGTTAVTINNGRIYTMNLTGQIVQGTGGNNREGDSVQLEAIKIEGHFQTSADSNAYKFRVLIGYSGEEYSVTTLTLGNLTDAEIFQPGTATTITSGIVNPKAFTVLYDQVLDLNSQIEANRTLHSIRDTIQLNKKFPYQSAGSIYGKSQNLYMVVVSYQPDTAIDVANGSAILAYDLIYKD